MWDDYCPAPPFDLGIDEPTGITGEEGKVAEDKGVANAATPVTLSEELTGAIWTSMKLSRGQ